MITRAGDKTVQGIDRQPSKMLLEIEKQIASAVQQAMGVADQHASDSIKLTMLLMLVAVIISFGAFMIMVQKNIITPANNLVRDFIGHGAW